MILRPLILSDMAKVDELLSTRLQNTVPRLNAPAALAPTPGMVSTTMPLQARSKTYAEEAEEMAEALRQDLAASFVPSPTQFIFSTQSAPAPGIASRSTDIDLSAALHGGDYSCEHCRKAFQSPYAVNGHKAHSKECSLKGRSSSLGA